MGPFRSLCIAVLLTFSFCSSAWSQEPRAANSRQKIILDTDIGGDIDDAFALAFVLASSEFEVLGITTAWGDTQLRARLVDRMLCETGMSNIPVMAGIPAEQAGLKPSPSPRSLMVQASISSLSRFDDTPTKLRCWRSLP